MDDLTQQRFYPGPQASSSQTPLVRILTIAFLLATVSILAIVILFYLFGGRGRPRGHVSGGGAAKSLTGGLIRRGWIAYFMVECGHCQRQKELLDLKAFAGHYVEIAHKGGASYVKASLDPSVKGRFPQPPLNQVPAYPFWFNLQTGEKRTGFQDAAALRAMAK